MFSASILDNIRFFSDVHTESQVEEAARLASVYDNIVESPTALTRWWVRGITLSGGQKQRISIARAIIRDPSILILDDSLSAVDTKTEEEILQNLHELLQGKTGIIIAHRISTIKHADQIVVLDDGKIIELGTHQELLARKGYYARLYHIQLAETTFEKKADII